MTATVMSTTKLNHTESDVAITYPQLDATAHLHEIVGKWVKKQGRHWPEEITTEQLIEQISHRYLPYWVVSGTGSGQWSASIGVEHQVQKTCGTCGGRGRFTPIWSTDEQRCDNCAGSGQTLGSKTFWSSQSGFVQATVDGRVIENFDAEQFSLNCGKRKFSVDSSWLSAEEIDKFDVIPALNTNAEAGHRLAEKKTRKQTENEADHIASQMGQVKNLQVVNLHTQDLRAYLWLYPLLLGQYAYDNELCQLQIDGVTGKIWGEVPKSIKNKQWKDRIVVLLVVLAVAAIGYGIWALGFNSGWW